MQIINAAVLTTAITTILVRVSDGGFSGNEDGLFERGDCCNDAISDETGVVFGLAPSGGFDITLLSSGSVTFPVDISSTLRQVNGFEDATSALHSVRDNQNSGRSANSNSLSN